MITPLHPSAPKRVLLLSCEHAVNYIPEAYQSDFDAYNALLETHRGIDIGAQTIAQHLKMFFSCALFEATVSRLLIDCNRSLNNPRCFSEITRPWSHSIKHQIVTQYYAPFRDNVINTINQYIQAGYQVWHLSIHSFTPILNNQIREADIGLLYDPKRFFEKKFAEHWQEGLKYLEKALRVRMNYPYLGKNNGFTTTLRKLFRPIDYLGLEVETNQAHLGNKQSTEAIAQLLALSLRSCLEREYYFV